MFSELLRKVRGETWQPPERLLALDPGETVGWARFDAGRFTASGQLLAKDEPARVVIELFDQIKPTVVVCEDYRVYAAKAKSHTWQPLFTPKLIGAINMLCEQREIPLYLQMASTAKCFCTDARLKQWGFYSRGSRHANDAARHGAYFLLFCKRRYR